MLLGLQIFSEEILLDNTVLIIKYTCSYEGRLTDLKSKNCWELKVWNTRQPTDFQQFIMNIFECFYCNAVFDSPSDVEVQVIKHFEEEAQESESVDEAFRTESDSKVQFTLGTESAQNNESLFGGNSTNNDENATRELGNKDYIRHHNAESNMQSAIWENVASHPDGVGRVFESNIRIDSLTEEQTVKTETEIPLTNHAEETQTFKQNLQIKNEESQQCKSEHTKSTLSTVSESIMNLRSRTAFRNHTIIQNKKKRKDESKEERNAKPHMVRKKLVSRTTEKKALNCDICFKAFSSLKTLKAHMSVHSEIKAYICELCHKRFRSRQGLKEHKYKHTGERPYTCRTQGT